MGMKIVINKHGQEEIAGHPAGWKVGMFFGILLLIVGFLSIFGSFLVGGIILLIANIILFASNRYQKGKRQEFYNRQKNVN